MNPLLTEDAGLIAIHRFCRQVEAIWRPTSTHDLGIDGQIEMLELGRPVSTGVLIAVQSKSGTSYFEHEDADCFRYYPKKEHRAYWSKINLPVVLFLYNPENDFLIFSDVKSQILDDSPLKIPKRQLGVSEARTHLMALTQKPIDCKAVADRLKSIVYSIHGGRTISGIELLLAFTNEKGGFIEIRMCRATTLLKIQSNCGWVSIGSDFYDFIYQVSMQIEIHDLCAEFCDEFHHYWNDLHMTPDIYREMTPNGAKLVSFLMKNIDSYIEAPIPVRFSTARMYAEKIIEDSELESQLLNSSDRMPHDPI